MKTLLRALPSLDHLVVFEAAARLGNFTRAAAELGMTQAAVSYAVRAIERSLGVELFVRRHRSVALTSTGETLFASVSLSLGHVGQTVAAIRRSGGSRRVTLSVSNATATWFILPRLAEFRARHAEIDLLVKSTDRDLDLVAEGLTLGIRYGPGVLPSYQSTLLASEEIYPVCSAEFLRAAGAAASLSVDALAGLRLIHLLEPFRPCPTWRDWFSAQGVTFEETRPCLSLSDYGLVVQAAIEGQGVALGWRHLVSDLVDRGVLVRLTDRVWRTETDYVVVWAGALGEDGAIVRDWIVDEARRVTGGSHHRWRETLPEKTVAGPLRRRGRRPASGSRSIPG